MDVTNIILVGFQYHCTSDKIDSISEGYRLMLKRDLNNEHDPLAVGVYDDDILVAYVKKELAHQIWNDLDKPLWCVVTRDNGNYKHAEIETSKKKQKNKEEWWIGPKSASIIEPWTVDNLKELTETARELARFQKTITNEKEPKETLRKHLKNSNGKTLNLKSFVAALLLIDIAMIYENLGHKLGKQKPEDIGMALVQQFLNDENYKADFTFGWFIHVIYQKEILRSLKEFRDTISTNVPNEFEFYFQALLSNMEDDSYMQRYMVLMYRFASLVAKADGEVTKKEAKWLAKIMQKPKFENEEEHREGTGIKKEKTALKSHDKAMKELMELIGLVEVKEEIARLRSLIQIQNRRKEEGLTVIPVSRHFVFTGNPGTGKTTVARILAKIYKNLGVVKGGQLIETDRSGLVAEYVGQTAVKTNKVIDSALDGVLFIDEAYSLLRDAKEDYGGEAVATLLKRMEDNRDRLVVILAGYQNEMQQFIDSNPGLQSRFNRYIHFSDYTAEELVRIFKLLCKKNDFVLADDAESRLLEKMQNAIANKTNNFGNARFVRNMFEKTLENQAVRLSSQPRITRQDLITIQTSDL